MNEAEQNIPAVTILIPNYNGGDYLVGCVNSALAQDYPRTQICIVDDGSTDGSWNTIYSEYFKGTPHESVVYTHPDHDKKIDVKKCIKDGKLIIALKLLKNSGPSVARNIGIDYAWDTSDAYCLLDSDDEMYPNKISSCVRKFLEDPERIGVICSDYDTENAETNTLVTEFKEPYEAGRLHQECIVFSASFISKKALDRVKEGDNYFDPELHGPADEPFIGSCEDYDMWVRISESFMIIHIPEPMSLYRVTGKNSSIIAQQKSDIMMEALRKMFSKMNDRHAVQT